MVCCDEFELHNWARRVTFSYVDEDGLYKRHSCVGDDSKDFALSIIIIQVSSQCYFRDMQEVT